MHIDFTDKATLREAVGGRLLDTYHPDFDLFDGLWAAKQTYDPPWARMVFSVFSMDADATEKLQATLKANYVKTYQRTLRNEIDSMGCKPGRLSLTDDTELMHLDREAEKWATGIANTYNTRLSAAITKEIEAYRAEYGNLSGINRHKLAKPIKAWSRNYWRGRRGPNRADGSRVWIQGKNAQVSITEQTRAYSRAINQFYERSKIGQVEARVSPGFGVCPICRDLIARGWMPMVEANSIIFPVHPNCLVPGQDVLTENGLVPIEDVAVGDEVITPQGQSEVLQAFAQPHSGQVYRLEVGGRVLRLTGNHPVLTKTGWLPVQDLSVGQEVLVVAG